MKRLKGQIIIYSVCVFAAVGSNTSLAHAQLGKFLEKITPGGPRELTDAKAAAGVKDMLKAGVENAIKEIGRGKGYLDNPSAKIAMPEKLKGVEKTLKALGMGQKIDEFVSSMNNAAEEAVLPSKKILFDAISRMNVDDAKNILKGGDTAATEYFKAQSYDTLLAALKPLVTKKISEYKVTEKYRLIMEKYKNMPFASTLFNSVNIDSFVTGKALDGLFTVMAQQEQRMRADPGSKVNGLLKQLLKQ